MLNTRARGVRFGRVGDGGWYLRKIARLEGSHEANKIMRDQIYDECVPMRELIRQFALTPLNTLLEKYKGRPSGGPFF